MRVGGGQEEAREVEVSKGLGAIEKGQVKQIKSESSKRDLWSKVAQAKKALKKYEVKVSNQDGVHMVEILDEIIKNSTPL